MEKKVDAKTERIRIWEELLKVAKPEEVNKPKEKVIEVKPKDPIVTSPLLDELVFYVFYPNNYSGVDDDADGIVKPMEYLINGIGTNKYLTENNSIEDYGTQLNNRLYGYEMGNANGISTKNVVNQTGIAKETPLLTTDKNVKITEAKEVKGAESYPVYISKFQVV